MIYDKNGVDIYFLNNATLDGENLKVQHVPRWSTCSQTDLEFRVRTLSRLFSKLSTLHSGHLLVKG